MKSLVVNQLVKQIDDNGTELKLEKSQIKRDCEYIATKEITIKAVKVTIDENAFKTAIGGTLSRNYYYFQYSDNQWNMYDGAENVDLADYGITLDGDILEDDRVYVYCDTAKNEVKYTEYQQEMSLYRGTDTEKFNYVNISCEVPNFTFAVYSVQSGGYNYSVLGGAIYKSENFLATDYKTAKINAFVKGYFDETTIKIIVAKVI